MNTKELENRIKELELEVSILKSVNNKLEMQTKTTQNQSNEKLLDADTTIQNREDLTYREQITRVIFDYSFGFIGLLTADGKVLDINKTALDFIGISITDVINKPFWETPWWSHSQEVQIQIKEAIIKAAKGEIIKDETFHYDQEGSLRNIEYSLKPVYNEKGEVIYIIPEGRDNTDFKIAKEKLEESNEKYRGLSEATFEAIFISEKGVCVGQNQSAIDMFGYTDEEALGRYGTDWIIPEDRPMVMKNILDKYEKPYEATALRKDGTTFPCVLNGKMMYFKGKDVRVTSLTDVSERKKAEEELRMIKLSLDASTDGSYFIDIEGRFVYVNDAGCKALGYSRDELLNMKINDVNTGVTSEVWIKLVQILKDKLSIITLSVHRRKDGSEFPVEISSSYVNIDGKEYINGFAKDITERKKAEDALRASELKYKELFESNTDGITLFYINTQDGTISNIIDANENSAKMLGYAKEEFLQRNPADLEKDITIEKLEKRKYDLLTKGFSNFETIIKHKDGREINVEIRALLVNYNNKPALMNIVRDITERKKLDETIVMLAHAIKSITEFLIITDLDDNFLFVNDAFVKTFQYEQHEIIGKHIDLIRSGNNDYNVINKILPETINGGWQGELINRSKDGNEFYVYINTSVIKDDDGKPIALIGVGSDITERKQALQELINAKEKAEESDRLKSAFLANMSHEIRTPMNGIMGFAELLKEPHLNDEEQKEYVNVIQKSGVRMLNIINDIISISKIEAGLMEVSISETNFNEQLDYIFTFFKPEVDIKKIKLSYSKGLTNKEAIINTDREKVYSILTNLVKNAIKYTDKGYINFGYTLKNNFIEFYIKDSGIGIPFNRQIAIFERFIQADIEDKRALQGAGLGLAITKAYVEMLGGEIWLVSEEGKGSQFYFTLPYTKVIVKPDVRNDISEDGNDIDTSNLNILIVEDDEISDKLISRMLLKISQKILHVRNGIDAVETVRNNPDIDLILMDVNLPEMDGYEAVRLIREFNKDVIIIAQTAYAIIGEKEKSIAKGCNNYLSKPIDQALLKSLIMKYFGS
ncbi:MAG: PAS domain S-box protein [Bacteroidota bacterium]